MPNTSRKGELSPTSPEARRPKMADVCNAKLREWWYSVSKEEWDEVNRGQIQATYDVNRDYIEQKMVREAIAEEQEGEKAVYRSEWE